VREIQVNISSIMMITERKSTLFYISFDKNSTLKLDLRIREGKRRGKGKGNEQHRRGCVSS